MAKCLVLFTSEGMSTVGVGGRGMGFSIFCKNLSGFGSTSPFSFSSTIDCNKKKDSIVHKFIFKKILICVT